MAGKITGKVDASSPIPISALQHYSYCPRQCGLIHIEQVFTENLLTIRGSLMHSRVDSAEVEVRDGVRIERSVDLVSERHGLTGKSDVIEFHSTGAVVPVEYKHGKRHAFIHDDIQLCAQAICLEEMLDVRIPTGFIFHYSSRRRREVELGDVLRGKVIETACQVREMLALGTLPPPAPEQRCRSCSLKEACCDSLLRGTHWDEIRRRMYDRGP